MMKPQTIPKSLTVLYEYAHNFKHFLYAISNTSAVSSISWVVGIQLCKLSVLWKEFE